MTTTLGLESVIIVGPASAELVAPNSVVASKLLAQWAPITSSVLPVAMLTHANVYPNTKYGTGPSRTAGPASDRISGLARCGSVKIAPLTDARTARRCHRKDSH